jgi:hypothetical protein
MNLNESSTRPTARPRALVVYESMFGNTEAVARAIGDGLAVDVDVVMSATNAAPAVPPDLALLVVGGPTHAFSMSRPNTRRDAGAKGGRAEDAAGIGVREWLIELGPLPRGVAVAAFDTKIRRPRLPGSAARAIRRRLRRAGAHRVISTANFYVTGTSGPLAEGELERARSWGTELATSLAAAAAGQPPVVGTVRP